MSCSILRISPRDADGVVVPHDHKKILDNNEQVLLRSSFFQLAGYLPKQLIGVNDVRYLTRRQRARGLFSRSVNYRNQTWLALINYNQKCQTSAPRHLKK